MVLHLIVDIEYVVKALKLPGLLYGHYILF